MESQTDINPFDRNSTNASNSGKNGNDINGNKDSERRKIRFTPDDLNYDMSGERYLVIFNYDEYDTKSIYYYKEVPRRRTGSDKDVKLLRQTFEGLGFQVDVHHNKTREELWDIVLRLRGTDFSAASCLCIAILTHGSYEGELCAYDRPFRLQDVTKIFEKHPDLAGKPKLFFIQACRGKSKDAGNTIRTDGEEKGNIFVTPSHADFAIMRSTVEEYVSYRDQRGSWFIQELCHAIEEYHDRMDFLHIMTMVHRKVAYDYASYTFDEETNDKRQVPETRFTLTKFLKF